VVSKLDCLHTIIWFHFNVAHCSFPIFELWVDHFNLLTAIFVFLVFAVEVVVKMYSCDDMPGK
jgi:hypothetical protein